MCLLLEQKKSADAGRRREVRIGLATLASADVRAGRRTSVHEVTARGEQGEVAEVDAAVAIASEAGGRRGQTDEVRRRNHPAPTVIVALVISPEQISGPGQRIECRVRAAGIERGVVGENAMPAGAEIEVRVRIIEPSVVRDGNGSWVVIISKSMVTVIEGNGPANGMPDGHPRASQFKTIFIAATGGAAT